MIENHQLWLGSEAPRPRPFTYWALPALRQGRTAHMMRFNEQPHTAYIDAATHARLMLELARLSDYFPPLYELTVYGMRVYLEDGS